MFLKTYRILDHIAEILTRILDHVAAKEKYWRKKKKKKKSEKTFLVANENNFR